MGANQSSTASEHFNSDNDAAAGSATGEMVLMTSSPLSSSLTANTMTTNSNHNAQVKLSALSSSPRTPRELFHKSNKSCKSTGKDDIIQPCSEISSHVISNISSPEMDLARGAPARSSILRGSFRRPKILNNVPPPVIPQEKFNRLSNVSLGSSGFGSSGSSQESTASSDSSSSSTMSSTFVHHNNQLDQPENPTTRKARMNLKLSIIPSNPNGAAINGFGENLYGPGGDRRFNLPRSPLASPIYNSGNEILHSPVSESAPAVFRNRVPAASNFHPDSAVVAMMMVNADSIKSPTRSDYVELMCSSDSRHSRSSFSSFDGSTSNYSFNNSPSSGQILDISAMFHAGMNDNEVLSAWLGSIGFTEYFANFVQAGYDMGTAVRMTTEDLTAIGITKPNHRKRIRAEIARLPTVDLNFGCDLPEDAVQFFNAIGMRDYLSLFLNQNYQTIDKILNLTWEDFEELGIKKLGHLKKLTLAVKHFRAVRRQTALSSALEEETRRFSTSSYVSQLNSECPKSDDDKSSVSRNSTNSPKKLPNKPILTTFQAVPSSMKEGDGEAQWRPRSALGGHHSPLLMTPETEELCLSWNESTYGGQVQAPPGENQPSINHSSVINNNLTCTLPRRKSLKIGSKSIAKIMAQVFRSDKTPSAPSSPNKDQPDSFPVSRSPSSPSHLKSERVISPVRPLGSFTTSRTMPAINRLPPCSNSPRSNPPPSQLDLNDHENLSRFPPPPSPLLREYPNNYEVDVEKTPTLPHRTFPPPPPQQNYHQTFLKPGTTVERKVSMNSMPFAQDNIGTIKQRNGRNVPLMDDSTFRDPKLNSNVGVLANGTKNGEVALDEITGMLADLTSELDEAMHQLDSVGH